MYLLFDYFLGMQKALNDPIADLTGDLFRSKRELSVKGEEFACMTALVICAAVTHCCFRAAAGCVWWRRTSPRRRCPWSQSGTSNRTPPSSRRTSRTPLPPSPRRWWPDRSGTGSSCPRPPVSSRAWSRSGAAAAAPDGITERQCHQNLLPSSV